MWQRLNPRLATPWTSEVSPANALPEYPRPQLTRPEWLNLNGVWQFAAAEPGEAPPFGQELPESVLVPYPIESVLSGIARHEDHMWYRREVTVPDAWDSDGGHRVKLHFGAVDYRAVVYVNGVQVTEHTGGYGRFSADITEALVASGPQEIVVGVDDRTDATWQPIGKQRAIPDRDIFYTSASGIWQTVWMEPVDACHVEGLDLTTDLDTGTLTVTAQVAGNASGLTQAIDVLDGDRRVATASGPAGEALRIHVPEARWWSPEDPFLYGLQVRLESDDTVRDSVGSYVGFRAIGTVLGSDGKARITLNNQVTFLLSTLDQGYWPDGIYTAPTDAALAFDLREHKRLGFNTVRKHIKVEPDRWYYWADRLGLLVWQDMPSVRTTGEPPPPEAQQQFEAELRELVAQHRSWTSIIGWIPFNEGWGEWSHEATGRIADDIARHDPTRLVNAHSGVNMDGSKGGDSGRGHVLDWHEYVGPAVPPATGSRVAIDGEHGGFGLEVPGHMWYDDGGAYQMASTTDELTRLYVDNQRALLEAARDSGLSGAVYTQITDVEHEVNGFYTYDRAVEKMDFDRVRDVNQAVIRHASDR